MTKLVRNFTQLHMLSFAPRWKPALQHIADKSDNLDWGKHVDDKVQAKLENYRTLANIAASDQNTDVTPRLRQMNETVETGRATVDATFSAVLSRGLG